MKIVVQDGMVTIDGDKIAYANIRDMYSNGNGSGVQLNTVDQVVCEEVRKVCDEVSKLLYKLEDMLEEVK